MKITLAGTDLSGRYYDDTQLTGVSIELHAFDLEIGLGTIVVPDPAGTDAFAAGREMRIDEGTTCLVRGFIGDSQTTRGAQPLVARQWSYSVEDPNALITSIRATHTRPSESDYARVMAFAAADIPSIDTSWVLNANLVTLPATVYSSDNVWTDLQNDTVSYAGKTLFIHDTAAGVRHLHYHRLIDGHTCGLSISDVPGAYNGTTVFAPGSPTLRRLTNSLWNDVSADAGAAPIVVTDSTSITNHNADGRHHQLSSTFTAGSVADLTTQANRFLADNKEPTDTWLVTIGPLDATALALIRVGDLITVTSQLLGVTAATSRIAHMTLNYLGALLWEAVLEITSPIRLPSGAIGGHTGGGASGPGAGGGGGGSSGGGGCLTMYFEMNSGSVSGVTQSPVWDTWYDFTKSVITSIPAALGLSIDGANQVLTATADGMWLFEVYGLPTPDATAINEIISTNSSKQGGSRVLGPATDTIATKLITYQTFDIVAMQAGGTFYPTAYTKLATAGAGYIPFSYMLITVSRLCG